MAWAFEARQAFALTPDGLTLRLSIRNRSDEPAPAGIGWHPYLLCAPASVWRHDAQTLWRLGADFVPTGESVPYAAETDDNLYLSRGWSRARWSMRTALCVAIKGDPALDHLILHRPATGGYLCIEPVSHVADGFNLAARGVEAQVGYPSARGNLGRNGAPDAPADPRDLNRTGTYRPDPGRTISTQFAPADTGADESGLRRPSAGSIA